MPPPPNYPAEKLLQLAVESLRASRPADAETAFNRVIAHDPTNSLALQQLSLLAFNRGQHAESRALLETALAAAPQDLSLLSSYGVLLHETGHPREALDAFLRALAIDSKQAEIWNAAGICFQETGTQAKAMEFYLRAITLQPDYAEAYNNIGVVLTHEGDNSAAIDYFRQALKHKPEYPDCFSNLAVALRNRFKYTASIATFRQAHRLRPENADIAGSLGEALSLVYDPSAEAMLRLGVSLKPTDPEKHWNLALDLLKHGHYLEGWREYARRWERLREQEPAPVFSQPEWLGKPGQDIRNTTILLHAEQGLGDTLQFLRYVPLLLADGANVLLQVQPPLQTLIAQYAQQTPGVTVLTPGEPLPPFDWHIPFMTLPVAFATTLQTIPPPQRFTAPRSDPTNTNPIRIGIAWAGNPHHKRDVERSIPIQALGPLFALPDITWVSLQVGPAAAQIQSIPIPIEQPHLRDFLDTANLIDTLDLVLAVDTAVAHLAASQGVPTWILLPYVADWRWLLPEPQITAATPNPWYPQAQIFRQTSLPNGEPQTDLWQPVITTLLTALQILQTENDSRSLSRGIQERQA